MFFSPVIACGIASLAFICTLAEQDPPLSRCFSSNQVAAVRGSDPQDAQLKLFVSQQRFSVELVKIVAGPRTNSNVFFSPHSIYQALLLAYFIAQGQTEESVKKALQLPEGTDKVEILQAYKLEREFQRMRLLNSSDMYDLSGANRIFAAKALPVRACAKALFEQELAYADFKSDPQAARKAINKWVEMQTKDQIKDLLASTDVHKDTKMIIVNAAYFKGFWQSKFEQSATKKSVFYISPSRSSLVTMMTQEGSFKYLVSEKLGAHIVQLPYKGEDISMFILLPPFVLADGVDSLLSALTAQVILQLAEPGFMMERMVELSIPKFEAEQELELVPVLQQMGVGDLFEETSNLSALAGDAAGVKLNSAIHKAKVSVDEEGTTAGAATALFSFRSSRPAEPIKFTCNHPFLYYIYDNISQSVLFMGIYNSPDH